MMDELKISALDALREIYPEPQGRSVEKQLDSLDKWCRKFIAHSPFLVLGTKGDVSPKGDAPGFVQVIDDNTILLPDRKGNNRLDSMQNVLADSAVGLIFLIPGITETLRVNGRAEITTDIVWLISSIKIGDHKLRSSRKERWKDSTENNRGRKTKNQNSA